MTSYEDIAMVRASLTREKYRYTVQMMLDEADLPDSAFDPESLELGRVTKDNVAYKIARAISLLNSSAETPIPLEKAGEVLGISCSEVGWKIFCGALVPADSGRAIGTVEFGDVEAYAHILGRQENFPALELLLGVG